MKSGQALLMVAALVLGVAVVAAGQEKAAPPQDDVTALKAEVARLKGMVPDQSHAMADVGFHFTNLWFAGQAGNWPLAQFYSDEVRSHLKWAVRIIPKRKDAEGKEVDLGAILAAIETSSLKDLSETIKAKDKEKFAASYKVQLEACMSCHKATNKPYLRLHIPERPDAGIVEFRPE